MNAYENGHKQHGDTLGACPPPPPPPVIIDDTGTGSDGTGTDGADNTGSEGTGTDGTDNTGNTDTGTNKIDADLCSEQVFLINPEEEMTLTIANDLIITLPNGAVNKTSTLCVDEIVPAGKYASGIYNVELDETILLAPIKISLHYDADFVANSTFLEDDLTILQNGVDVLSTIDKNNRTVTTFTFHAGEITVGVPASVYYEKYGDDAIAENTVENVDSVNAQISTETSLRLRRTVRQASDDSEDPLCKNFQDEQITLNNELRKRFSAMLKQLSDEEMFLDKEGKLTGDIPYDAIDGCRSKKDAHRKSTVFALYHLHIPLLALKRYPIDIDENVWYKDEWSVRWTKWCTKRYSFPYTPVGWLYDEKDVKFRCIDPWILNEARLNALKFAEQNFPGIIAKKGCRIPFMGCIGKTINYAEEGYHPCNLYRKPNINQIPVSRHTKGDAIDLGKIAWKQKFGDPWSEKADDFVSEYGLSRPIRPENYKKRSPYANGPEHWHFELPSDDPSIVMQSECISALANAVLPPSNSIQEQNLSSSSPTVHSVSPLRATFGVKTDFTVSGTSLPNTTTFRITDCENVITHDGGSSEELYFQCTPSGTIGSSKQGEVTGELNGESFSYSFIVEVQQDIADSNTITDTSTTTQAPTPEVEPQAIIGSSCGNAQVYDCELNCVSEANTTDYQGDGSCDDGEYGLVLTCPAFNNDGGDCDAAAPTPSTPIAGASCGSDSVYDCELKCVAEADVTASKGDSHCDDGTYGIVLTCPAFNNDAGDCDSSPEPTPTPSEEPEQVQASEVTLQEPQVSQISGGSGHGVYCFGTPDYWHQQSAGNGGSIWTQSHDAADGVDNYCDYNFEGLVSGNYEVQVWIPPYNATTLNACYKVSDMWGTDNFLSLRQLDYSDEWVSLGIFATNANGQLNVTLTDLTKEGYLATKIGFDAVKVIPASGPVQSKAECDLLGW